MMVITPVIAIRVRGLERLNYAAETRTFDCKFIEPGIVYYPDAKEGGMEVLSKQTIEQAMPSIVGAPVTMDHVDPKAEVPPEMRHGVVTDWYYDAADGWFHVKGVLDTKESQQEIKFGGKASCAYNILAREAGAGRTYHGFRYKWENTDIRFHHLAIVAKGRYEGADFRLNHKPVTNPEDMKFKAFWKTLLSRVNGAEGQAQVEETVQSVELPADAEIELDGRRVRLNSAFEPLAPHVISDDDTVEVEPGKPVKVADLKEAHRLNAAPKVVGDEDTVEVEPGQPIKVSDLKEAYRLNAAQKAKGLQSFEQLQSARTAAPAPAANATYSDSPAERLRRGNVRY